MDFSTKCADSQEKPSPRRSGDRFPIDERFTRIFKSGRPGRYTMPGLASLERFIDEVTVGKPRTSTSAPTNNTLQGGESSDSHSPDPNYPWAKKARATFEKHSNGEVELLSSVYEGDDRRHKVLHRSCGHHFLLSLAELRTLPKGKGCPHCHGTNDLTQFGTMEDLQISVYHQSEKSAYFYASNHPGSPDETYRFWCVRHGRSYEATFSEFQRTKGHSNGCPLCREVDRRLSEF